MSSIKLSPNASGTGALTIAAPNTNTDVTFNLGTALGNNGASALVSTDNAGNLGLGVTPSAWSSGFRALQVQGASVWSTGSDASLTANAYYDGANYRYISSNAASRVYHNTNGSIAWFTAPSGTAGNAISFTQAMTLDASGRLGIGTSSPTARLDLGTFTNSATNQTVLTSTNAANASFEVFLKTDVTTLHAGGAGNLAFSTGGTVTERARIDSSGNLLVGKTSTSSTATGVIAYGSGSADHGLISIARGPNATMIQFFNASTGNVVGQISQNGSNTTYSTSSDYRLKEDIAPMTGALAVVQQLKPCTYKWKADGSDGQGFIAHELQAIVPDSVVGEKDATKIERYEISPAIPATYDEDGNELTPAVEAVMGEREVPVYQGIDTSFLVATLTAAIQEQQALITAQAAALESLTARIEALEAK